MKRFLFCCLVSMVVLLGYAQIQRGYVKTRGRLDAKGHVIEGKRLTGVIISIKGLSPVGSGEKGAFSFNVLSKTYSLTNVQSNGYQLCDYDLIGRSLLYSPEELIVVMDTPEQVAEDRLQAEKRIRQQLERQLEESRRKIEKLRIEQIITEEQYQKQLQELFSAQSANERHIQEIALRYATTDFDQLNELQRKVEAYIQNGDFYRADSLLNTKGSMDERSAELDRLDAVIKVDSKDLAERREAHNKSVAYKEKMLEDFASDCYRRHEMCLLQHKNDSALYWLELRTSKNPNNVMWNLETGLFVWRYMADYDKAARYFDTALQTGISLYGECSLEVASCYNNKGLIYVTKADFQHALECYYKSLSIRLKVLPSNHSLIANSYNNIGDVFHKLGDKFHRKQELNQALDYFRKALEISKNNFGCCSKEVAGNYNNIGGVYNTMRDFDNALLYFQKALDIRLDLFGSEDVNVANSYNNIGLAYYYKGNEDEAVAAYKRAIDIQVMAFGETHPETTTTYNNLGILYLRQRHYDEALFYLQKAICGDKGFVCENDIVRANRYDNLGIALHYNQRFEEALIYYQRALKIRIEVLGERHLDVAKSYSNIGWVFNSLGNYDKALAYFQKDLDIRLAVYGKNHEEVKSLEQIMRSIEAKMKE